VRNFLSKRVPPKRSQKSSYKKTKNIQLAFWLLVFAPFKDLIFNRRKRNAIWGLCGSSPGPQTINSKNRSENIKIKDKKQPSYSII